MATPTTFYYQAGNTTTTFSGSIGPTSYGSTSPLTAVVFGTSCLQINANAFTSVTSLVSVQLSNTIITMGNSCFRNTRFTTITIPNSVAGISSFAFQDCILLQSVYFEDGSTISTITTSMFLGCVALNSINLPISVLSIQVNAFRSCINLQNITLPSGLIGIGINCFLACVALRSVTFPDTVTIIRDFAFGNCTNLTSISLPQTAALTLGPSAFSNTAIPSITIYPNVSALPASCFQNCGALTSVIFSGTRTLASIGDYCFAGTGLTAFNVPSTVTTLSRYSFSNCANLSTITFADGINLPTFGQNAFANSGLESIVVPSSVTLIDTFCFQGCASLSSATFATGSTLDILATGCFDGCSSLPVFQVPGTVTTFGSACFANCSALTTFYFEDQINISTVGAGNFVGCNSMHVVYFNTLDFEGLSAPSKVLKLQFPDHSTFEYNDGPPCFGPGTQILVYDSASQQEQYVDIDTLREGQLVCTYKHGPKPVALLAKGEFLTHRLDTRKQMFCMKANTQEGVFKDLYLTGGHGLLVDEIPERLAKRNRKFYFGDQPMIEGKYMLSVSCAGPVFVPDRTRNKLQTYYQFALREDNDIDARFGVYANGVLVETPSVSQLREHFKS